MTATSYAKAFAPASVANVFVGFDILGFSVPVMGDTVSLKKVDGSSNIISITGTDEEIPIVMEENTAGYALLRFQEDTDLQFGFEVTIEKGIPLASGLGGSAASAVASIVAANVFLDNPLDSSQLLQYAIHGESVASGSMHGDNAAASLYGGLTAFVKSEGGMSKVLNIPVPDNLFAAIAHPSVKVKTKDARQIISDTVKLKNHVGQSMDLIQFIVGCYENDTNIFGNALRDRIVERQRKHLIPYFDEMKTIAHDYGALGFTIAGAGPTVIAMCDSKEVANEIAYFLHEFQKNTTIDISTFVSKVGGRGSHVVESH